VRGALYAAAWLAGVAAQLQMAALWPGPWVWAAGAASALALMVVFGARRSARESSGPIRVGLGALASPMAIALAIATLAFAFTHQRAALRLADALPASLEGIDLVVTGVVSNLPRHGPTGTRFVFHVESATLRGDAVKVPQRLSLGWYRGIDDEALLAGPPEPVRAGQRWSLTVRLRQPHGSFNPHGFDLELWLFEQGIRAGGSVRAKPDAVIRKLGDAAGAPVERLRESLRDAIDRRVADPAVAGVLAALAIGDQAAIERADWDLFRTTGIAHLMSISGLHVTMFAWLAAGLVGWAWRRSERLMTWLPAPVAARWGGVLLAMLYALLAGWGVPAQRTVWMLATVALLRSVGVRWPAPLVLLAAAVVVSAVDPWALLQPGFWLSFVAVGLLIVSEPAAAQKAQAPRASRWSRAAHTLRAGLRTQALATIGLAPLSMVFFQQISIVGFVANLLAIPLVTLLITPLALAGALLPPLWAVAAGLVQALSAVLKVMADVPGAVWTAAAAPAWAIAAGLLGALVAVLPLPWRLRALAVPLALPLLWPAVSRPSIGEFELVAADVGQGTAVLVRTTNRLLVYDTGPAYTPEADAGGRVLLPLLRGRGEARIDVLMLSHRDADHVGGAATLLAAMPVGELLSSLADDHPLRANAIPHRRCDAGQSWQWDGVRFEVLHPQPDEHAAALKPNAVSCVLRIVGVGTSALLTGDIEAAQEAALVRRSAPGALTADVLLVPHHGSRTSSTPALLAAVQPRVAIAQAAYRSRFGHPAPDVAARYGQFGVPLVRSDRCGAWTLQADTRGVCERGERRRYWHHPASASAPAWRAGAIGWPGDCNSPTQNPQKNITGQEPTPCPSTSR